MSRQPYTPQSPPGYVSPQSRNYSSRSAYPSFLSPQETAFLQLKAAGQGLLDALRWDVVVRLVASDAEVRSSVFKSLLMNSVSLTSIYFFDLLLLPLTREKEYWLHRNVGWFYQVMWLLPVVGVSLYLNVSDCATFMLTPRRYTFLAYGN
ncbi:hypothetical protein PHLCEN_2v3016 [Hermanssonia centrifuga]|uniref:Uncharacterized protein n=1 Tax=Hermanssonia centrifuga TaxID=98765 RepID=A0A2R6R7C5_9APHY|nr:hypothetical protein PHLCEN_2v3016 [Hermanssonia centrifuga]